MASSCWQETCPQCGRERYAELNCNTFEEWYQCGFCGSYDSYEYERDDEDKIILDERGSPIPKEIHHNGKGVACIHMKNGTGVKYSVEDSVTDDMKKQFLEDIEDEEVDKENCYLTSWNEDTQTLEVIYGNLK